MKKKLLIFLSLLLISGNSFAQDTPINGTEIKKHLGLLIGIGASVPIGIVGIKALNNDRIDAPKDSVLYYKTDKKHYTVEDHNSDITVKMGAFLLVDVIACAAIGQAIDILVEKRKSKKENVKLNFSTNIFAKQIDMKVIFSIPKL